MLRAIARVLFWTYLRGSWQYDILCGLILCFIFLTPPSVFDGTAFRPAAEKKQERPETSTAEQTRFEPDPETRETASRAADLH